MNRWEWTRTGAAIGAAIAVLLGGSWVGSLAVPSEYPARQGYQVPGLTEPPIDLASLQRSWPAGLSEPGGAVRLVAYMSNIEKSPMPAATAVAPSAPKPQVDLGTLLAHADIAKGKQKAQLCVSCHTFDPSGPDRVGPNLWAIVGRDIAGHPGFAYSAAVTAAPGKWTYESLDRWLASPARDIPGTKMAFAGIRRPEDRANLLAYLGSLNSVPAPFPKPAPATPEMVKP